MPTASLLPVVEQGSVKQVNNKDVVVGVPSLFRRDLWHKGCSSVRPRAPKLDCLSQFPLGPLTSSPLIRSDSKFRVSVLRFQNVSKIRPPRAELSLVSKGCLCGNHRNQTRCKHEGVRVAVLCKTELETGEGRGSSHPTRSCLTRASLIATPPLISEALPQPSPCQ